MNIKPNFMRMRMQMKYLLIGLIPVLAFITFFNENKYAIIHKDPEKHAISFNIGKCKKGYLTILLPSQREKLQSDIKNTLLQPKEPGFPMIQT